MGRVEQERHAARRLRCGGAAAVRALLVATALGAGTVPARTGRVADCAPLDRPPGFRALQDAEFRDYDVIEFTLARDGEPATEIVAGVKCYQVYVADEGSGSVTVPELHARYRERLTALGAHVLFADRQRIHARVTGAGRETWFRINVQDHEVDVTVLRKKVFTPTLTRPGGRDHRLIGHMPHYVEVAVEKNADDVRRFTVPDRIDSRAVEVRGTVHEIAYAAKSRDRLSSDAEIQENYRAALRARGADILLADWRTTVARFAERGRMIWVRVASQVSDITVLTVEQKLPAVGKRPTDAALKAALDRDGGATLAAGLGVGPAMHARVDRGIVGQVVRLLRRDRALAVTVVAHTDDLGDRGANLKRSQALAEAVVEAVVKQGIARSRLAAAGAGPDRPVADNATEEGRAANRRLEIVRGAVPQQPRQ
jgi:hypothetical protein